MNSITIWSSKEVIEAASAQNQDIVSPVPESCQVEITIDYETEEVEKVIYEEEPVEETSSTENTAEKTPAEPTEEVEGVATTSDVIEDPTAEVEVTETATASEEPPTEERKINLVRKTIVETVNHAKTFRMVNSVTKNTLVVFAMNPSIDPTKMNSDNVKWDLEGNISGASWNRKLSVTVCNDTSFVMPEIQLFYNLQKGSDDSVYFVIGIDMRLMKTI